MSKKFLILLSLINFLYPQFLAAQSPIGLPSHPFKLPEFEFQKLTPDPILDLGKLNNNPCPVFSANSMEILNCQELIKNLAGANIIYAGEFHDQKSHHQTQAALIALAQAAWDKNPLAVGFEMLDVTQQEKLDALANGSMNETEFAAFWKEQWGFDYDLYRPIFKMAKDASAKLIALNAPRALVRQASAQGLDSLKPEERALLAKTVHAIQNPDYQKMVEDSFKEAGHGGDDPEKLARYVYAMQIWNETMAENVLKWRDQGYRVIVIAGMGHLAYKSGIAEGVKTRRPQEPQSVFYPYNEESCSLDDLALSLASPSSTDRATADYFWLLTTTP